VSDDSHCHSVRSGFVVGTVRAESTKAPLATHGLEIPHSEAYSPQKGCRGLRRLRLSLKRQDGKPDYPSDTPTTRIGQEDQLAAFQFGRRLSAMGGTVDPVNDSAWSHTSLTDLGEMTSHPLTAERFADMRELFGGRGVARRCFCMYWRRPDGGFGDERDNRDRFADRVGKGRPPGLLGYIAGRPVGWVQVGPRDEFPTVERSRLFKPVDGVEPWTINCFVVAPGHRRKGIATGLAQAAVEFARREGAQVIEAYPVDGYRSSSADYYTGTLGMFEPQGFVEVIRRNATRPIVRLNI
jgi:GNAT superfamily N-acetyltransferase